MCSIAIPSSVSMCVGFTSRYSGCPFQRRFSPGECAYGVDGLCHFPESPIGNGENSILSSPPFGVSRQLKAKKHSSEEDGETEQPLPKRKRRSKKRKQVADSDDTGLPECSI